MPDIKGLTRTKKKAVKFSDEDNLLIVKLRAEGLSYEDVSLRFLSETGRAAGGSVVARVCRDKRYEPYLVEYREAYMANVREVPVANKRVRLDMYEKMRQDLLVMLKLVDITTKEGRSETIRIMQRLAETCGKACEEMEGTRASTMMFQQFNSYQYNMMSDEELQQRKDELIAKALGTYAPRNIGIGEDTAGDGFPRADESS